MLKIYIDESGSFVPAEDQGSWSVTAALTMAAPDERRCKKAITKLKVKSGAKHSEEIKLKDVSEKYYLEFLAELRKTECSLFAVAIDVAAQTAEQVEVHREGQALKIEESIDKMIHPEGADSVRKLAAQVRSLSPQLHLQLVCQIELMADIVQKSILYYVQRSPRHLNGFRWRIDEKSGAHANFEKTFRTLVPPLLQSKSLEKPHAHVTDFDYLAMNDFVYAEGTEPTYLEEHYDIDAETTGSLNIGKIVWDDFEFVDSKKEIGVQVVDLLASGLRRVLKGGFTEANENAVSAALGSLMIQSEGGEYPMSLIMLTEGDSNPGQIAAKASEIFRSSQKQLLA